MASYFPSIFQASSMPKRLLQYALSRLEILDTDTLDLENLDIAFGKNSVFEFRDVGLRLKKLETLLQLPPSFELLKSRVLLLRVVIPVDIYSSPILVEVNGVECQLRVKPVAEKTTHSRTNHDRIRRHGHSVQKKGREGWEPEGEDGGARLPTAADLAQSFLATQPRPEEKAELEAALQSEAQEYGTESTLSDDGDDQVGMGAPLSLPAFMTGFLQGIVDRLQVRINSVVFTLDVDIPKDTLGSPGLKASDLVTLQLRVGNIDVEGVTQNAGKTNTQREGVLEPKEGKRLVSLSQIYGTLISEASFFSGLARSTALSSPSIPHSEVFSDTPVVPKAPSNYESQSLDESSVIHESLHSSKSSSLSDSSNSINSEAHDEPITSSIHGRFDDASEDESRSNLSNSVRSRVDSELGSSSVFHNSAYLDQLSDSRYLDHEEENEESVPLGLYSQDLTNSGRLFQRSTPRASSRVPTPQPIEQRAIDESVLSSSSSRIGRSSMFQSSFGRKRFSEARLSQSQISVASVLQPSTTETASKVEASATSDDANVPDDEDDDVTPIGENTLAQSQYFSHEEAESMYLSAISHKSASAAVPGGWTSNSDSEPRSNPESPEPQQHTAQLDSLENANQAPIVEAMSESVSTATHSEMGSPKLARTLSFSATPEVIGTSRLVKDSSATSEHSSTSSENYSKLSKQLFYLNTVNIYLTASSHDSLPNTATEPVLQQTYESAYGSLSSTSQSVSADMPGAFSGHISSPGTAIHSISTPVEQPKTQPSSGPESNANPVEIVLGHLQTQFDLSIGRLLYKVVQQLLDSLNLTASKDTDKVAQQQPENPSTSATELSFYVNEVSVKFLERLEGSLNSSKSIAEVVPIAPPPDSDVLLRTVLKGLSIITQISELRTKTQISLKKFLFGYAQDNILSFDAALQMRSSIRDLRADGIDISAEITKTQGVTRFEVNTLPVHCSIDLQKLDETFSWFGGLSSVLNMGSSMASTATVTAVSPTKSKPRGVRFDAPIKPDDKSLAAQNKADVRIGGFVLDLVGSECSVGLETSAVKLVHRDSGLGASIQKIRLSGPHLKRSNHDPAIIVEVTGTRLEYLPAPRNSDLDRLLDIITPSKTKYDQADDILIDTLVRQRKQGPVLNVIVEGVLLRAEKLDELSYFPELGEEIAKLATVAKYLPEADRPGMLVLMKFQKFDAHVDVNNTLGALQLSATDINAAQITLPILVAISIGTLSARRNGSEELMGPAGDANLREAQARAPALMARMVGDAMEPTIKLKLWNLRLEYRVPTLMVILGLAETTSPQDLTASLTASVATLTGLGQAKAHEILSRTRQPDNPEAYSKPLNLDVSLKDCVIGLNPYGLPSKMLVVLTDATLNATLPKDQNMNASIDINKASLLIVDNVAHLLSEDNVQRPRRHSFDGSSQVADLCSTGYVSVSYISSAKAIVKMTSDSDGESALDVELRDDLFVLESCADSTQTLFGILGGLAPPSVPSKATKYRTKVIPVHDLLASLSGDAFGTAEGQYNFDDDFGLGQGSDISNLLGDGEADELDFDSQYYQGDLIDPYEEAISEDMDTSLHSAKLTSTDTHDGVLLESLLESNEEAEANHPLEFLDDHFATGSVLEDGAHRWNSSANTYDTSKVNKVRKSPLKIHVRDVHIIWNLFDGYDWQNTRDIITKAVHDVESKAIEKRARSERRSTFDIDIEDDETVIGDFLFNSIYIGIPANKDPRELSAAINMELNDAATETESLASTSLSSSPSRQGGHRRSGTKRLRLNRSKHHKITFELRGVNVDLVTFPPGSGETQSSIDIRVHDLEVFDHIPTSTWKLFATYMQEAGERETGSSMVHIEILNVKPIQDLAASEIVLKATILPLRLHVDQDALDFITRFFEFKDDTAPVNDSVPGDPPFIQRAEVNSIVVKLDFKPKRVDYAGLRSGHTTEFMNFLILEEADMVMRHTIIYGVSGLEKLGQCLNDIWMPDVKRNQLPGILAGLAPVRSLVNVGGGIQKLVLVPMQEYKKDGRIVRSISKGAAAFAKTTGTELVKLGAKVAIGVQTVLQGAEGFLGPTTESSDIYGDDEEEAEKNKISLYANQPVGVMQGLKGGYAGLQRDLLLARDAIIAVPGEVMEGGNAVGVLRAVRKHAPTVILRPAIGVAKAGGQILMGATNSLDPSNLQRADAKYKKH